VDTLFENEFVRTKNFHKEIVAYYFFKKPVMMAIHIILTIILIPCILSLFHPGMLMSGKNATSIIVLIATITIVAIIRYAQTVKISYNRDFETNQGEPCKIRMILTSDGIDFCRIGSDLKTHLSYLGIRKAFKTRNYYVLLTEENQYFALKKDGFVKGKPDEFLPFMKTKITKRTQKKSKKQIISICFVGIIVLSVAVSLYIANGRTVFNNRSAPTEAELETIHQIIAFEQEKLSECTELLAHYESTIRELGIEIRLELTQRRSVNHQGLVENHDWSTDMWLPTYYSSDIMCYVYKDGRPLVEFMSYNTTSFFGDTYWLLYAGKKENTTFNETLFEGFDITFDRLLDQVSKHLQK